MPIVQHVDQSRRYGLGPVTLILARTLLFTAVLAAVVLRFYQLGRDSLRLDEILTQQFAKMRPADMITAVASGDVHPPLFYLVAHFSRVAFGGSDFAARLPAVFAGVLAIPAAYALGRRLWGWPAGILAAWALAFWPAHLHYSQESRMYAQTILLGLVSLYWMYRSLTTGQGRAWLGYAIATALALYTHFFSFMLLAGQGVFVALWGLGRIIQANQAERGNILRRHVLPFIGAIGVFAVAYVPWFRNLLTQQERLTGADVPLKGFSELLTAAIGVSRVVLSSLTEYQQPLIVALLVALIVGVLAAVAGRRWCALLCGLTCMLVPLTVLAFGAPPNSLYPHRVIAFLAPLMVLVTGALAAVFRLSTVAWPKSPKRSVIAVSLLALLLGLSLVPFDGAYYGRQKEDWRGVASYLAARKMPADIVVADGSLFGGGGDAGRVCQALPYYLDDGTPVVQAESGLHGHLPSERTAPGTAWGVFWVGGRTNDRAALTQEIEFAEFKDILVLRLKQPSGRLGDDTAKILEAILRLQASPQTHPDLDLALAELYDRWGQADQAQAHFAAAQKALAPGDSRLSVIPDQIALSLHAAQAAAAAGDLAEARALFRELSVSTADPTERFKILMAWAIMERFLPNLPAALDLLEQALQLQSDDVEAHANYGAVLLDANRPEDAIREFEFVLRRAPEHFWAYYYEGFAYQRSSRPDLALAALQRAIAVASDEPMRNLAITEALRTASQLKDCQTARGIVARFPTLPAQGDDVRAFLTDCR